MAGVPGLTREQKIAALKADMRPGDYIMDIPRKGSGISDPMIVRQAKRDTGESMVGALGALADKVGLKRLTAAGAASLYGLDEVGNPELGKTPGLYYDTLSMGTIPTTLLRGAQDYITGKMAPPGFTESPEYLAVQEAVFGDPKWASEAVKKSVAIDDAVHEDMNLAPPQGWWEHLQESLGTMLTQLPIPGGILTKGAKAAPSVGRKIAELTSEYITPTITPKISNYVAGTAVGTGLGVGGDYLGEKLAKQEAEEWRLANEVPEGYGVLAPQPEPEYEDIDEIWYSPMRPPEEEPQNLAKGSLVKKYFTDVNKKVGTAYHTGDTPGLRPPNTQEYLDLIDTHGLKLPKRRSQLRLLEEFSDEGPWALAPYQNRNLLRTIDKYGIELPPDIPLYRGVSGRSLDAYEPFYGLKPKVGEELVSTLLPTTSLSTSKGAAKDFASTIDPEHWANYLMNIGRERPIKAFPMMTSGHNEWVVPTKKGKMMVKKVHKDPAEDYTDVDIDYNQFAKGGKVGKLLSDWASSHMTIGDAGKYRLAQKVGFNPRMKPSEYDLLEYQADVGSPHLSQSEYDDWLDILNRHSVPVPEGVAGDITTWRGVRLPKAATIDDYLKTTTGEHPLYSDLTEQGSQGYALHPAARHMTPEEYADIVVTGHPNLLQITPEPGTKIFPNVPGIANEVIYPPGHKLARVSEPWDKLIEDRFFGFSTGNPAIPAKAAQVMISKRRRPRRTNMQEGGSVKDNCEGGMATISSMKRKYANGGPTGGDPVQAITDALSHLDRGDSSAALQALQRSPQAMQDPGIQRAVQGFAKGGKVASAATVLMRTRANKKAFGKDLAKFIKRTRDVDFAGAGDQGEALSKIIKNHPRVPQSQKLKSVSSDLKRFSQGEEEGSYFGGDTDATVERYVKEKLKKAKGGKVGKLIKGGPLGKPFNWSTPARQQVKKAVQAWEKAGGHGTEPMEKFVSRLSKDLGAPETDVQNIIYEAYR